MSRRGDRKDFSRKQNFAESRGTNRNRGRGRPHDRSRGNLTHRGRSASASASTECLFSTNPSLRKNSFSGSSHSLADYDHADGARSRGRGRGSRGRGRGNDSGPRYDDQGDRRNIRPLNYVKIQELLQKEPNEIVITLVDQSTGFKELLNGPSIGVKMLIDILKLLAKAFSTSLHQYNQNSIMAEVVNSQFFVHVSKVIFGREIVTNLSIFEHLADIFVTFFDKMPDNSCEHLEVHVRQCEAAARIYQRHVDGSVLVKLQELSMKMEGLQEQKRNELMRKRKVKLDYANYQDEPPDDYRETDIIPSIEEITTKARPFLRPNIVEGAYKDVDHYLDVQFRLLRECFISPLRDGVTEFLYRDRSKDAKNKKIKDIRLYEDVRIVEPKFDKNGMFYCVQFSTKYFGKIKWEITNRLIFGSLLCLSSDNFATAIFASVADRKPEDLKNGIVTVKFEDEFETRKELTKLELKSVYIMAESQAYFESFRHVLKGLQTYDSTNLPLQNYIIHVQRHLEPPEYLDQDTIFDFTNAMDGKPIENDDDDDDPFGRARLHRARVVDIRTWPAPEAMGLDESQRRAMHLALSSAVAVIQGPPGTGKTYMGLKMVKMLLSNKHVWRPVGESNPILVVCLTNHALDQFLEGMLGFTQNLIRVGGRSKNESLSRHNLKVIKDRLFFERRREGFVHRNVEQINFKLRVIRQKIEVEKQKGLLLNAQILHESALTVMSGHDDGRLVESLIDGFIEFHELDFDPRGEVWCPTSFLATWLGLAINEFVDDGQLDDFLHDESDFEVVGKKRRIEEAPQPDFNLLAEDEQMDSDDGLIDVEDETMAANRHRQMEAEEMEEVQVLKVPSLNSSDWCVSVGDLDDPEYLMIQQGCYHMVVDERGVQRIVVDQLDPVMYRLYQRMGTARKEIATRELAGDGVMSDQEVGLVGNVWQLVLGDRWRLYRRWVRQFKVCGEVKILELQREYVEEAKRLKEVINAEELSILRDKDIIGMTTTGAAKYLETLRELKPSIVIVEEAAEVLEAHIITTLSSSTKHLILIGDHKQLRPSVSVYRLSQDYHMDVSLFERLIRNKVRFETLQLQHRMRPEISQILKPHIYETLEDHPTVRLYPRVKGITTSLFFFNHENPEESVTDSTTRRNPFEARYLAALCRYLLQQGYEPSQITILAAYAGQLFELRKHLDKNTFEGVKVTVVDNYQGEENDIILLSFVRSNEEGQIGFLKIDNRINVALSRAKIGLYCVGNFKFFASKSPTWRKICNYLEIHGYTGDEMTLQCQKHNRLTIVRNENDFRKLAPEGGCLELCGEKLPCDHYCSRVCHVTRHGNCEQKCNKVLCELQHECPLKCYQICEPCRVSVMKYHLDCEHSEYQPCHVDIATIKCKVLVERDLACGHKVTLECHFDVDRYQCLVKVKRELPYCNHERVMSCFKDPAEVKCKVDCGARLECGHACPKKCHPRDDPDHESVECKKRCEKKICERGHKCKNLCFQPCNECLRLVEKERPCGHKIQHPCSKEILTRPSMPPKPKPRSIFQRLRSLVDEVPIDTYPYVDPCGEPCTRALSCGHPCKLKCSETCGDCKEIVDKFPYCGHVIKAECRTIAASLVCTAPCRKSLPCGHLCLNTCGDVCEIKCSHLVQRQGLCGHVVDTPCYLAGSPALEIAPYCKHSCRVELGCGHLCKGSCGECRQGRVHVPCKEDCGRVQICGHSCTFPCALVCPPCIKKCSNQCVHSRCPKKCGMVCKKCKERCTWRCAHHECSTKCGDMCNRDPCDLPCRKFLDCGHPCIGLCGEKCPKLCRVCDREKLLEFVLYGYEEEEDARFIQLGDCGHCIEVQGLDYWMREVDQEEIKMKECPRCKSTIWKSTRYGNIIKQRMADIQAVKKKLFGKKKNLRKTMQQVHQTIHGNRLLKDRFPTESKGLSKRLTGKQAVHQNQLIVIQNQVNLLVRMTDIKEKFSRNAQSSEAKRYFEADLAFLVDRLMTNKEKMNEFEITDIGTELTRIELYTMYLNVLHTATYRSAQSELHLATARKYLASSLKLKPEEEKAVQEAIRLAATDYVPGLGITRSEQIAIVQAIGLGTGHWYKCSNGHPYAIGECGGAMQESKCADCGVPIGGHDHRLIAGNAHAGEMDGSRRPAYGDHVGLGNYDLHDLI